MDRVGEEASCSNYAVHDVIVKNSGANALFVTGVTYTYVISSDFGPVNGVSSFVGGCAPGDGSNFNTTHVALDGNTFHDLIQTADDQHLECIHWYDGSNAVIRNNTFLNCAQQDISFAGHFVTNAGYSNVLIENNIFDATCSDQKPNTQGGICGSNPALVFNGCGAHARGIVIRFNSFSSGDTPQFIETDTPRCFDPLRVYGNIMLGPASEWWCKVDLAKGIVYSHNIFTTKNTCGTTNSSGNTTPYVDPGDYDFSLKAASRAIGFVPSELGHPQTDISGDRRPLRSNSDAGADQRDPALVTLGHSIGMIRMGKPIGRALDFYGKARRAVVTMGAQKLERVTFRVRGGLLWAFVDGGLVAGIGTTSPYYTTANGLGVNSDAALLRSWSNKAWIGCRKAFSDTLARSASTLD